MLPACARRCQQHFYRSNNANCGQPSGEFNARLAVEPLDLFSQHVDTNRPLQFQKRSQLFIGMDNKAVSVVAVRVSNPYCSPLAIQGPKHTPRSNPPSRMLTPLTRDPRLALPYSRLCCGG